MEKLILEEIQHQDNLLKLNTKLWLAIKNSDLQKSQELLQQGANLHLLTGVILRRYDLEENTPLHIAAKEGSLSLIKLFIEHNTPVDVRNRLKQTPLQWASYYGHLKIVEYLIAHNADIDAIDIDGDPSLTWAASKGEIKVVNYLITQGADPAKVSPLGNTALHWVAIAGETKMAEYLISLGCDPTLKNAQGYTALDLAIENARADTAKLLGEYRK